MRKRMIVWALALLLTIPAHASNDALTPVGGNPAGYIALTFDDGPSGAVTETFLEELERRGASCTFFVCGYRIEEFPMDLSMYASHGHELGVHGWSHQYLRGLDAAALNTELDETALLIEELSGVRPAWLRPPGGFYDEAVCTVAQELELSIALWSVDPEDWHYRDQQHIVSTILAQVTDGDVVLLHDIFAQSRDAALELVTTLRQRGYELVTLSELAALKGSAADPGAVYSCFG